MYSFAHPALQNAATSTRSRNGAAPSIDFPLIPPQPCVVVSMRTALSSIFSRENHSVQNTCCASPHIVPPNVFAKVTFKTDATPPPTPPPPQQQTDFCLSSIFKGTHTHTNTREPQSENACRVTRHAALQSSPIDHSRLCRRGGGGRSQFAHIFNGNRTVIVDSTVCRRRRRWRLTAARMRTTSTGSTTVSSSSCCSHRRAAAFTTATASTIEVMSTLCSPTYVVC